MPANPRPTATLIFRKQRFELPAGMTIRAAILKCDLNPDTLLIVRNGELLTDDFQLEPDDEIKLVATISGG
jgi:sulfur carrier protein ThiS